MNASHNPFFRTRTESRTWPGTKKQFPSSGRSGLISCFRVALFGSVLGMLLTPGSGWAGTLAYEGFQYPVATPMGPAMAGGSGWLAPWIGSSMMVAQSPTLNYPLALPPTPPGNNALLNPGVGEAFRDFAIPLNNLGSDLWLSFMEETTAAGSGAFVQLMPVGASPTIIINKDGGGTVSLSSGGVPVLAGPSSGVGNVDFMLLHVSQFAGSSTVELFLNPTGPPGLPSASFTVASAFNLSEFYYRSDPAQELDEIRVGTLPTDVSAVPEPATGLLMLSAGFWFLMRSRKVSTGGLRVASVES